MSKTRQARYDLVAQQLGRLGIKPDQYVWTPKVSQFVVNIGGKLRVIDIGGNMSRVAMALVIGRLQGWHEATHG